MIFIELKLILKKKIESFSYTAIEWRPFTYLNLDEEQSRKLIDVLNSLEELDDVQNIFTNANLKN